MGIETVFEFEETGSILRTQQRYHVNGENVGKRGKKMVKECAMISCFHSLDYGCTKYKMQLLVARLELATSVRPFVRPWLVRGFPLLPIRPRLVGLFKALFF